MRHDLDCVIPVAGESTRMGQWKPLLPWGSSTIVETTVGHALTVCRRVILVAGHRGDEIAALFKDRPGVVIAPHPEFSKGFLSSVQTGARRVTTKRFFVTLADMPLIRAGVYRELLAAPASDVVRPYCHGNKGHPVLISSDLIPAIAALPLSASMADVFKGVSVVQVETEDPAVYLDLDDPADYERLRSRE